MRFLTFALTMIALAGTNMPSHGEQNPPIADPGRVRLFITYLKQHGVTLTRPEAGSPSAYTVDWWRVKAPPWSRYTVRVIFRTFPLEFSEAQMREILRGISLAYRLNPAAHMGMSLSLQVHNPADHLENMLVNGPEVKRLNALFDAYRLAPPARR